MKTGYIYKITNIITQDFYIGQTASENIEGRFGQHLTEAYSPNCKTYNSLFKKHIRKYTYQDFHVEIIETLEYYNKKTLKKYLFKKEKYYIYKMNPTLNSNPSLRKYLCKGILIVCYLKNGDKYREYQSITEASIDLNISDYIIRRILKDDYKYNKNHKYYFKYADNAPEKLIISQDTEEPIEKKCEKCKTIFNPNSNRQKYCKSCNKEVRRLQAKERQRIKRGYYKI